MIFENWWNWAPKKICKNIFFYENIFFPRCEVWDEVVEQKGALPPSKSSIGSKKSAQKTYEQLFVFYFYIFYFKLKYDQYFPFWATSMHFVACS